MNTAQILALYDEQMRRDPPPAGATIVKLPGLTRCMSADSGPHGGWILYTQLDGQDVEQVIRDQIAAFAGDARGFEWKTFDHDRPADLRSRLAAHGFTPEEPEALLVLDLANAPARLLQPPAAEFVAWQRVNHWQILPWSATPSGRANFPRWRPGWPANWRQRRAG